MTNAYDFFPHGDSRHYWYFPILVRIGILIPPCYAQQLQKANSLVISPLFKVCLAPLRHHFRLCVLTLLTLQNGTGSRN